MSRTVRCKNATAHGWVVRDGGDWFYPACCPNREIARARWKNAERLDYPPYREECECDRMRRRGPRVVFYNPYRKERKAFRKRHQRQYRAQVREAMAHEAWEKIQNFQRTGGWLTW